MRVSFLAVVLALVTATTAAASANLRVTYWADGRGDSVPLRWTLRCGPAAGTLPRPAAACSKLAAMRDPFTPPPRDQPCTLLYGGPQEAIVAGSYEGRRIWIRLSRTNGCEIARFDRLRFLLPAFRSAGESP